MFHEFYDDTDIGEDKIADSRDQVLACLTNLPNSTSFREAVSSPFVEVKNVEEFVTFYVDDTPIHAVPDLVYRKGDDMWTVVDWKSGNQQGDDTEQALVYALYVRELRGVRGPDINVRIERLVPGTAEDHSFTQDDLDGCIDVIRDSISAMKTYLRDADLNALVERSAFHCGPIRRPASFAITMSWTGTRSHQGRSGHSKELRHRSLTLTKHR